MDIKPPHIKELYHNRLLESEDDIETFENALTKITKTGDAAAISDLCTAFDDETAQFEVMFNLVHVIEGLYENNMEEGLACIAEAVPVNIHRAREWLEILHYRILNHSQVRAVYGKVLRQLDSITAEKVKGLLAEIKQEDPDAFGKSVDDVLGYIERQ